MIDDQMIGAMSITFAGVRYVVLANATLQAQNHRNQHRQTIGCKTCVFLKRDTRRTRKRVVLQIVTALANLALLCTHLGDHCGGLQIGQTVITGSLSGLHYFPEATDVVGHIDGFGSISCQLR